VLDEIAAGDSSEAAQRRAAAEALGVVEITQDAGRLYA